MSITYYEESIERLKTLLFILFAFCYIFCTSYMHLYWNPFKVPYLLEITFKILNAFKSRILIPLLIILETLNYVIKVREKDVDSSFFYNYLIFIFIYFCSKAHVYNWILCEAMVLVFFSKSLQFSRVIYVFLFATVIVAVIDLIGLQNGFFYEELDCRGLSFGFTHSNQAAEYYSMFLFALIYSLRNNKIIRVLICVPFLFLSATVFKSRTATILIFALTILLSLEPVYHRLSSKTTIMRNIKKIFIFSPIILMFFSILMALAIYNNMIHIDGNAATRFIEIVLAYKEKGLSFSSREFWDASRHYFFDNGYAQLIFVTGIIYSVIMHLLFILNNIQIAKEDNYIMMVLFSIIYIYMLMEFVFSFNFPFVLLGYFFAKPDTSGEKPNIVNLLSATS